MPRSGPLLEQVWKATPTIHTGKSLLQMHYTTGCGFTGPDSRDHKEMPRQAFFMFDLIMIHDIARGIPALAVLFNATIFYNDFTLINGAFRAPSLMTRSSDVDVLRLSLHVLGANRTEYWNGVCQYSWCVRVQEQISCHGFADKTGMVTAMLSRRLESMSVRAYLKVISVYSTGFVTATHYQRHPCSYHLRGPRFCHILPRRK